MANRLINGTEGSLTDIRTLDQNVQSRVQQVYDTVRTSFENAVE